ncbi:hypothetical protein [Cohnella nanjingensis]|uniref:Uncharacterized protein n=1 Tax=Cohnella nanjingensis TaxID=1387779 RepID=A0A7X0RPI4_9BACL|nr:hypothetical protein [Cohnella nanjingensis]MBB6669859.1 hypothetical protein [Cohnella nanjingensis]
MRRKRAKPKHRYALIGYDPVAVRSALEALRSDIEATERTLAQEDQAFLRQRHLRAERNGALHDALKATLAEERRLIDERGPHEA